MPLPYGGHPPSHSTQPLKKCSADTLSALMVSRTCLTRDVCLFSASKNLTQHLQYNDLVLTNECLHDLLAVTHESLVLRLSQAPTRADGLRLAHYQAEVTSFVAMLSIKNFPIVEQSTLLSRVTHWAHSNQP